MPQRKNGELDRIGRTFCSGYIDLSISCMVHWHTSISVASQISTHNSIQYLSFWEALNRAVDVAEINKSSFLLIVQVETLDGVVRLENQHSCMQIQFVGAFTETSSLFCFKLHLSYKYIFKCFNKWKNLHAYIVITLKPQKYKHK